jgi:hypothetical protein
VHISTGTGTRFTDGLAEAMWIKVPLGYNNKAQVGIGPGSGAPNTYNASEVEDSVIS